MPPTAQPSPPGRAHNLIEINFKKWEAPDAKGQLLVFMWCRTVDIGAHHVCWLLLQAWFITASAPTVPTTTVTSTITKGLLMG